MWVLGQLDYSPSAWRTPLEVCTSCIFHGVDWVYTFIVHSHYFDFEIIFFTGLVSFLQDSFYNVVMSVESTQTVQNAYFFYNCYLSDYVDRLYAATPAFFRIWYHFASGDQMIFIHYFHPELFHEIENATGDFLLPFVTIFRPVLSIMLNETVSLAITLFPQYLMTVGLIGFLFIMYLNYFNSSTTEENIIDHDFLIANAALDAEEEIGSLDDILFSFVIFFYVFSWFFYSYFWALLTTFPELTFILWLIPFVYLIILLIPASLLFDFGVYFLGYLRGVGSSSLLLSEILFDYIAVFAFFIRLVVQGVRLLLMFFVYASFHDLILYWAWDVRWLYNYESFLQDLSSFELTLGGVTYFFFFKVPTILMYFIYELLHTFFVVTAQFFAFIGMVFWLLFFLYTFFVFEPQEAYLSSKRKLVKFKHDVLEWLKHD